jgi:hypothetical protein
MSKIIVRVPENYQASPKDCPVCEIAFMSRADVSNYMTHGCCLKCDLLYRYPNSEKWTEGWRPEV